MSEKTTQQDETETDETTPDEIILHIIKLSNGDEIVGHIISDEQHLEQGIVVVNRPLQIFERINQQGIGYIFNKWLSFTEYDYYVIHMENAITLSPFKKSLYNDYFSKAFMFYGEDDMRWCSSNEYNEDSTVVKISKNKESYTDFLQSWKPSSDNNH